MLTGAFSGTGQSDIFLVLNRCSLSLVMTGTNVVDLEWDNAGTWVVWRRFSASTDQTTGDINFGSVARCRINCTTHDTADIVWTVGGNILAAEYTQLEGQYSLLDEAGEDLLAEDGTYLNLEAA